MTTSSTITSQNPVPGIAERAHQAVDRAADKATPAVDRLRGNLHSTIDKVADSASSGVDWAAENSKAIARKGSEVTQTATGYVRERPIVAIAGAFAVGYLVGRLLR
ncbi:MAG TPA: hypothetical protein VMN56_20965 [Casimicrobiaceae bacterium]|nr:hypothetical protein [Casimicrobiaceae bacterium]